MGSDLIVSGKVWTLEEMLAEVDSVNLEGVIESANKYLQPENLHFAGIGPIDNDKIKNIEDILRK
jgi:predicted Zn-dependent peptidase